MDEEEAVPAQMRAPQQMPQAIRAAALVMTGEFILIIGLLFVLLGMGSFITDFLKVKGSGEILVGLFLCALAAAFFLLSRSQMPKPAPRAMAPGPAKAKPKVDDSGSYR